MKNYLIYTTLLATALISSCSNEDEPSVATQGTPISFTIDNNGVTTKTSTAAESSTYKTTFTSGDQIGVYAQANSGVLATANPYNVLYTVNAGATAITSTTPIMMNTGTATFYAYSPYTSNGADNSKVTFTVQEDQREQTNFNASNFLTGTQTITVANEANNTSESLSFTARLALLRIAISGEFGKQATDVTVKAKKTITWTPGANSDVSVDDNSTANIQMYKETTADNATEIVFTAFVPAQTISAGTTMLNMTIGGRNYVYKPSTDKVLAAGKVNKLSIEIATDPILIASSGIISEVTWSENNILEDQNPTIINNLVLEGTQIGTGTDLKACQAGQWSCIINGSTGLAINATVNEGQYTMNVTNVASSSLPSWWGRGLYYKSSQPFDLNKNYKLSFNASGITNDNKLNLYVVYYDGSSTYQSYGFDNNTSTVYFKTINEGDNTYTIIPSRLSDKVGGTPTFSENTTQTDFIIGFTLNSNNVANYTISNVVLQAINNN